MLQDSQRLPIGLAGVSRRARKRRQLRKRVKGWKVFLIMTCLLLPTGCAVGISEGASIIGAGASSLGAWFDYKAAEKGEPVVVTPPTVDYSQDIMGKAATELEYLKPPCPRDIALENCSAISRMIIDYADLRQKIRGAKSSD